jgi:hypothetical protein
MTHIAIQEALDGKVGDWLEKVSDEQTTERGVRTLPERDWRTNDAASAWCGRRDLNPHGPRGPTDFRTVYGFRRPCSPARLR